MIGSLFSLHRERFAEALIYILFLSLLFSCSGGESVVESEGFSVAWLIDQNLPGNRAMFNGAMVEAKEQGITLKLLHSGVAVSPVKVNQTDPSLRFFSSLSIGSGMDAVIIEPPSKDFLLWLIDTFPEPEVPVLILHNDYLPNHLLPKGYIPLSGDHELGGRLAGAHLAALLSSKGDLHVSSSSPENLSSEVSIRGFHSAISGHPEMRVVGIDYAFGSPEKALFQTLSIIQLHPRLSGIYAPTVKEAEGVFQFLVDTGLLGSIRFISRGYSPLLIDAMERGYLDGVVLQETEEAGKHIMKELFSYLKEDKSLSEQIILPIELVTSVEQLLR